MENIQDKLKEAYSFIHKGNIDEAKIIFEEIYIYINKTELKDDNSIGSYISCLLGLGEIYMKQKDLTKSLEYYKEGYKLTSGKDFNILFNLGVVYSNLGDVENSEKFLDEAKKIDSNNANLIRFLNEQGKSSESEENNKFDVSFTSKIQEMIKKIK